MRVSRGQPQDWQAASKQGRPLDRAAKPSICRHFHMRGPEYEENVRFHFLSLRHLLRGLGSGRRTSERAGPPQRGLRGRGRGTGSRKACPSVWTSFEDGVARGTPDRSADCNEIEPVR
jgi:hypothetical protein